MTWKYVKVSIKQILDSKDSCIENKINQIIGLLEYYQESNFKR